MCHKINDFINRWLLLLLNLVFVSTLLGQTILNATRILCKEKERKKELNFFALSVRPMITAFQYDWTRIRWVESFSWKHKTCSTRKSQFELSKKDFISNWNIRILRNHTKNKSFIQPLRIKLMKWNTKFPFDLTYSVRWFPLFFIFK